MSIINYTNHSFGNSHGKMQKKWTGIRMERSASESSSLLLSIGLGLKMMKNYLTQEANSTQRGYRIIWNEVRLRFVHIPKPSQVFSQTVVAVSSHTSLLLSFKWYKFEMPY